MRRSRLGSTLAPTLALALLFTAGTLAAAAPAADAAGTARHASAKRGAKAHARRYRPRHSYYSYSRHAIECERARAADPTGRFRAFPCWAQEALSPQGGADFGR